MIMMMTMIAMIMVTKIITSGLRDATMGMMKVNKK